MTHPSKARDRWAPYLAFLWRVERGDFRFNTLGHACARGKLAARPNRNGYRRIPFRLAGIRYEVMEHVAFWIWWHGKLPPRGLQVNHIDLDRSNGRLGNLELIGQSGNLKHAARMRKAGHVGGKR